MLAAAVNQPVILLEGGERLNRYRIASWRRVSAIRARQCARNLIADAQQREAVAAALVKMSKSPPDPKTPPEIAQVLAELAPNSARPAGANPVRRSNALIPAVKYGVRDEIRNQFGFGWRTRVGGVKLTLDVAGNLAFRERIRDELARLQARFRSRINARYSLDIEAARSADVESAIEVPDVIIAAADANGAIVRYFDTNFTAAYFGSARGRDTSTGKYDRARESRFIASVAKMAAAVAIANEGTDAADTGYLDVAAPATGLEACRKGGERRLRRANVAFACSLNGPIEWRMRQIGAGTLRRLADGFALTRPDSGPGLAKGLTVGQVAASPRTVHRMAATILRSLTGKEEGETAAPTPTLLREIAPAGAKDAHIGNHKSQSYWRDPYGTGPSPIKAGAAPLLKALLSAPVCYRHGTLRRVSDWCADKRADVALHFAKTGTRGTGALTADADDTVDLWVAGGIQFEAGPAYSYVILVGTGNPNRPWGRDLYAGSVTEPLLRALLEDLAKLAVKKDETADTPATVIEATAR